MLLLISKKYKFILFVTTIIFLGFTNPISGASGPLTEPLPLTGDSLGKGIDLDNSKFPRNYRTVSDDIKNIPAHLPIHGLDTLAIAGTAQFTKPQLEEILTHIGTKTVVIDLREETHLLFEDTNHYHIPITAYASQNLGNYQKSLEEIEENLKVYKEYILQQQAIRIYYSEDSEVHLSETAPVFTVGNVYTEREVVEDLNRTGQHEVTYFLLPVTDHKSPSEQSIDAFISFLREMQNAPDTVLLFHCQAGRGRTGLFMVMTDMIKNGKKHQLSLHDILKRHEFLGSPDFSKIKMKRAETSSERYAFLQKFYEYVMDDNGFHSGVSYSTWIKTSF